MRILFVVVALCGVLVASTDEIDPEEYNEPSLCLQEKNPFSYSHCIKKRDTGCQNGGFCGTCTSSSCQACSPSSCRTTCNGSSCNQCPTGDCCNSQNCNVCSGMNCCTTYSCNSCTNSCNNGCSTFACRTTCLQTCQRLTTICNCNWEHNCFNTCRNGCIGDHCYGDCIKQCKCDEGCTTITPNPSGPTQPPVVVTPKIVIENKPVNSNPVNISTVINLRTFVNNINTIHNPINISISQKTSDVVTTKPKEGQTDQKQCCYVIHPVHCFNINQPPYKRCIQHRHWECSDICISVVVHLVHLQTEKVIEKTIPIYISQPTRPPIILQPIIPQPILPQPILPQPIIPPQPTPIQRCYYINQYPWIHCNHVNVQGCGPCYVCGNQQFNPTVCSTQSACSGLCRGGIVYDTSIGAQLLRYAPMYGPIVGLPPPLIRRQG